MRRQIAALLLLSLAGCRYQMDPVPLHGDRFELRQMAGAWVGEYAGVESGRTGTIGFNISTNADSAFGNVILTARQEANVPRAGAGIPPSFPTDPREMQPGMIPVVQGLRIRFVRVAGGRVAGTIQPYRAPDCQCIVHTAFTGRVVGDTIQGTFITTLADDHEQQGTWRVTRMKP
jgi:hypothetical protein